MIAAEMLDNIVDSIRTIKEFRQLFNQQEKEPSKLSVSMLLKMRERCRKHDDTR